MIHRVFGIKVRTSGLSINRYRPILLDADYRPADNRPLPYRCISSHDYTHAAAVLYSESVRTSVGMLLTPVY